MTADRQGQGLGPSIRKAVLFWWILFVVLQTAERLFLLKDAVAQETPTAGVLGRSLLVGLRGDFITATFTLVSAGVVAAGWAGLVGRKTNAHPETAPFLTAFQRTFRRSCALFAVLLFLLLAVDMGYYGFNRQHMDFVFLEYLGDLFAPAATTEDTNTQALKQTGAELEAGGKWAARTALFLTVQALAIGLWRWGFSGVVAPALSRWGLSSGLHANLLLCLALVAGGAGFHHSGPYGIRIVPIGSSVYYTLAQNPVLFAVEALRVAWVSRGTMAVQGGATERMPYDEAVRRTQRWLDPGAAFLDPRFPLVRTMAPAADAVQLPKPANIILVLLEGLDRRYLGRRYGDVQGTPFLDRLRTESLYFENFFSNGVQTSRGIFATLCSTYPRHGASAMKTRYAHDYLCLPSVLQRHGYRTEMVIGQHRDLNRLQTFLSRNGIQQLLDESDFPAGAERAGLGMVDGALFDLCYERIVQLQQQDRPFFLATLSLSTHHPFAAPSRHQDVRALQAQVADQYVAALRYTDLEFERLFTKLRQDGLLRNSIVVILGDHGRHEPVGRTDVERKVGHFASPLFLWMDESLRAAVPYHPRTVATIAGQVDVAPTLLALNGLLPSRAPFAGQNLSCTLRDDCLPNHGTYLTSVYDNLVGLVDREGLLWYSFASESTQAVGLDFEPRADAATPPTPREAERYRDLMALYDVSNSALDANRLWSWREFGAER